MHYKRKYPQRSTKEWAAGIWRVMTKTSKLAMERVMCGKTSLAQNCSFAIECPFLRSQVPCQV